MTAFRAEYVDKKYIKTRLSYQLVFEVPAEQIDEADAVLGNLKGKQIWAAIARLAPADWLEGEQSGPNKALKELMRTDGARDSVPPKPEKPSDRPALSDSWTRRFMALCRDVQFQRWWMGYAGHPENMASILKNELGIKSRADLSLVPEAQKKFLVIEAQYRAETGAALARCEGCGAPSVAVDPAGVELCQPCADALKAPQPSAEEKP